MACALGLSLAACGQSEEAKFYSECKDHVVKLLKAPATARFPADPPSVKILNNGEGRIFAYVDAQNSYGALIRTKFDCFRGFDEVPPVYMWVDFASITTTRELLEASEMLLKVEKARAEVEAEEMEKIKEYLNKGKVKP